MTCRECEHYSPYSDTLYGWCLLHDVTRWPNEHKCEESSIIDKGEEEPDGNKRN